MGDFNFPANKRGDVTRTITTDPPVHYTLEIQSYPALKKSMKSDGVIESPEFYVGRHGWQLCIYPRGDKRKTGRDDNLSLSLKWVIPDPYIYGDGVEVWYRFYIYDGNRSQYLIIEDSSVRTYNRNNPIWGILGALKTSQFEERANGFISHDGTCKFGVDVFSFERNSASATLAPVPADIIGLGEPIIFVTPNYLVLPYQWLSDTFPLFGREWKLKLLPKGRGANARQNMGLFLLLDEIIPTGTKLYVEYTLTMKNYLAETKDQNKHVTHWFDNIDRECGIDDFIGLNLVATGGFHYGATLKIGVTIKAVYLLEKR